MVVICEILANAHTQGLRSAVKRNRNCSKANIKKLTFGNILSDFYE